MEYSELKKRHFGTNDTDKKLTDEEIISSNAALDLINRQKAEIERLEKVLNGRDQLVNALNKCYKQAKSEAVKEFAEKLKEEWFNNYYNSPDVDFDEFVDNLLKEMVGED